jgi:hypothetical protein
VDETPGGWQSYADYLGLNEASLRELEAAAGQERAQANDAAQGALGRSYQEASADLEQGGSDTLTNTASYGDFLKAQRAAAQANAVRGMGYEGAAREAFSAGRPQPSFTAQRDQMQGNLDQRRGDIATGRANVAKWQSDQKTANDAQDKAFEDARAKTLAQVMADRKAAYYSGTYEGAMGKGHGSVSDWREANNRQLRTLNKVGKRPGST